jgi:hypothetical protein
VVDLNHAVTFPIVAAKGSTEWRWN